MKKIKYILLILTSSFLLNGCSNLKDTLTGNKKNNTDEFLIQKKNPLVLPPDFDALPLPKNAEIQKVTLEDDMNIKKILQNSNNGKEESSPEVISDNKSFEESLLKKIKKN